MWINMLCETFGCDPATAERQDLGLVRDVLEVRAARLARDLLNAGDEGAKELSAQSDLLPLLLRMVRAQQGEGATLDSLRRRLAAKAAGAASGPPGA